MASTDSFDRGGLGKMNGAAREKDQAERGGIAALGQLAPRVTEAPA
jgi:hypothetical protein